MVVAVIGSLQGAHQGAGEKRARHPGTVAAVEAYCKQVGATPIPCYTDAESGKLAERPELARALAHARRSQATLVVAKRLSWTAWTATCPFSRRSLIRACRSWPAPTLTPTGADAAHPAAVAEARAISDRTKAALAAYQARGGSFGSELPPCRNLTEEARQRGSKRAGVAVARARAAAEAYADLLTLQAIAAELSAQRHTTRRRKPGTPVQVARVRPITAPASGN